MQKMMKKMGQGGRMPSMPGMPANRIEAGVFAEVVDGLDEALAEGGFADDEGAVVILKRAGDDLCR